MRALVLSGGGSKGAYAGGVAEYLLGQDKKYDLIVGSSTGALMAPLIALGEIEKLKTAYTTVSIKDIWTINPFKFKKLNDGFYKSTLRIFPVLWNIIIRGQKSVGDSHQLRKTIDKFITPLDYEKLRQISEVVLCVTNITRARPEFKSSNDIPNQKDFGDWMWASSSFPPFMSVVEKEDYEYVDGGLVEHAAVQYAIDRGATEIDVIVLRKMEGSIPVERLRGPLHLTMRAIDMMVLEISKDDLKIAKLDAKIHDVKLNVFYTQRKLTNNPLMFDAEQMKGWWTEGFNDATNDNKEVFEIKMKKC